MEAGQIIFHKRFRFDDGALGQKFLVVLNTPSNGEDFQVCRTTSQQHRYPNVIQEGCAPRAACFKMRAGVDFFQKDTWIQFHDIRDYPISMLLEDIGDEVAIPQTVMKLQNISALLNCILKSEDIEGDRKIIFKRTLKELGKKRVPLQSPNLQ